MKKKLEDLLKKLGIKLKDNKKDNKKLMMTGSLDKQHDTEFIEELLTQEVKSDLDPTEVDNIMNKILSLEWVEKDLMESIQPVRVIKSDENVNWLYSLTKKSFCRVSNNAEIISVDHVDDQTSYCLIGNDYYVVQNSLIHCVGWN